MKHVLLLDKPSNLTSMQCVTKAKTILQAKKAGHAGTLDPKVTGLMLIAFDEAVKAIPVLMGLDKEYEGMIYFHKYLSLSEIKQAFKNFTGEIIQTPPVKSAVSRKPRKRKIYSLDLLKKEDKTVFFRVKCEAGTYIRKLCHDIGVFLGCGAHMKWLRRTKINGFDIKEAVSLSALKKRKENVLIPLENALERTGLKKIHIKEQSVNKIMNGAPVRKEDIEGTDNIKPNEFAGVYFSGKIIALAKVLDRKSSTIAKTDRVFLLE